MATQSDYLELQNCTGSVVDVTFIDKLGLAKDPYNCPSPIVWFERDKDFNMIEFAQGEISVEREDVTSNLPLKQTEGNMLSWSKSFPIQAKEGSKLQQYLLEIMINERSSERNGSGIIAYANGGIHYERTVIYNPGQTNEFQVKMVFLNLKAENFPDVYSGDVTTDTTYEWSILVEDFPYYFISGTVPTSFAVPAGGIAPSIGYANAELTFDSVTLTNVELLDPDMFAESDNIIVRLLDLDTLEQLDIKTIVSGDDYTYSGVLGDVKVELSYVVSKSTNITASIVELKQVPVITPATGSLTGTPTVTVDSVSGNGTYSAGDENINLSAINIALTSTPGTIIDSVTPLTSGTNAYSFTGLTAATDYTITMVQDTTTLDSATVTTSAALAFKGSKENKNK